VAKKASLNLSINAIVVLILAVTLLSLGLTFINSTFGGATKELDKSLAGIGEDRKSQLKEKCAEDICLEQTSVTLSRNEKETILIVLNNKLDCDLEATITIDQDDCQVMDDSASCDDIGLKTFTTQKLGSKQKESVSLIITPKNSATSTNYQYEVSVDGNCDGDEDNKMIGSEFLEVIVE